MSNTASATPYDKAVHATMTVHRAGLLLGAIDIILTDKADGPGGLAANDADIVCELVTIARSILSEAHDAASKVEFDLSGAEQHRRSQN